jgi:hypothetical protein
MPDRCRRGGGTSVLLKRGLHHHRNSTTIASSAGVGTVLLGVFGSIGATVVTVRLRHFATVFGFNPYRAARARLLSCDAWSSPRPRGIVRALR